MLELMRERYSVRKFSEKEIEPEKLDKILEAGRIAPTAKNSQPQRVYAVKSPEAMDRLKAGSPCLYGAPVVLVVAYEDSEVFHRRDGSGKDSGDQDASIVGTHMMLEAWSLGVGSCWVNMFDEAVVREALALPSSQHVVFLLPIGYPDMGPSARHADKKPLEETTFIV